MRIAFDHSIFTIQSFGGVSRYYAQLAQHLHAADVQTKIFAPLHINQYLDELPDGRVYGRRLQRYPKSLKKLARKTNFLLAQRAISKWRPDILHETYFTDNPIRAKNAAVVVTIYDMITELMPELFPKAALVTQRKKQALARADHIICISENTRMDLCNQFGLAKNRVSVVYPGVDVVAQPEISHRQSDRPYFLYVGGRLEYKNFNTLLRAFAQSPRLKKDFSIIAFGGGSFTSAELNLMRELKLDQNQIIHMSGSDQTLANQYSQARAFVYPTRYEGFGFPPLEAMALNCPVICSNASCVPEVVGNAALMFDPHSIEALMVALETLANDEAVRKSLIAAGAVRYKNFTWQKCATETRAIYHRI